MPDLPKCPGNPCRGFLHFRTTKHLIVESILIFLIYCLDTFPQQSYFPCLFMGNKIRHARTHQSAALMMEQVRI